METILAIVRRGDYFIPKNLREAGGLAENVQHGHDANDLLDLCPVDLEDLGRIELFQTDLGRRMRADQFLKISLMGAINRGVKLYNHKISDLRRPAALQEYE